MANNEKYTDYQHVETAMVEYDEDMMLGQKNILMKQNTSAPSPKFTTMYMAMKSRFMY